MIPDVEITNSLLLMLSIELRAVERLYFCRLLEVYVLIVQKTLDKKKGFESCLIVNKTDETFGSLIKFTANDVLSLTRNEDGVRIYETRLYCELIKTYGTVAPLKEFNWKGESVSAKFVPSDTRFLKFTIK